MSSSGTNPDENRRKILKVTGGLIGVAGLTGGLYGNEIRKALFGPDYVEEDELDDRAREGGREGANERIDEELEKRVYQGITSEDFQDVYETMRDDFSASDYNVRVGGDEGLHDKILDEDFYDRWTDEDRDGSLIEFDIQWGKKDAVDSKRGYRVEMNGDERYIDETIDQDGIAEAFIDAAVEELGDDYLEDQYRGDKW